MFRRFRSGSFVFLALFITAPIHAAPFDYRLYISILHRFAKPGIVIDGIRVTAVD